MDSLKGGKWVSASTETFDERAELENHAADVLREWFVGYTDPLSDGEQRRVVAIDHGDGGFVVTAATGPHFNQSQACAYAVSVTVRRVPDEPRGFAFRDSHTGREVTG